MIGTKTKWTLAAIAIVAAAFFTGALSARRGRAARDVSGETVRAAVRTPQEEAGVFLDPQAQSLIGLKTEVLTVQSIRPEVAAYGTLEADPAQTFVVRAPVAGVTREMSERAWPRLGEAVGDGSVAGEIVPRISPVDLVGLESQLSLAEADVISASASAKAARAAFERAKVLNADDRNVSDAELQDVEARLEGEEARLEASQEHVRLLRSSLAASKGPTAPMPLRVEHGGQVVEVLAQPGEAVGASQPILRVVHYDPLLARVDLPAGENVSGPSSTARIVAVGYEGRPLQGEVIARAAVDPKLQGQSFVLRVRADRLPLRPGMSVTAYLESPGPRQTGVIIPSSAIVWVGGKTWAYVEATQNRFTRREVITSQPAERGVFTRTGFSAGDRVVVSGAQALLSDEFQSQVQSGG